MSRDDEPVTLYSQSYAEFSHTVMRSQNQVLWVPLNAHDPNLLEAQPQPSVLSCARGFFPRSC
jgi:hypothetical protein